MGGRGGRGMQERWAGGVGGLSLWDVYVGVGRRGIWARWVGGTQVGGMFGRGGWERHAREVDKRGR